MTYRFDGDADDCAAWKQRTLRLFDILIEGADLEQKVYDTIVDSIEVYYLGEFDPGSAAREMYYSI